MKFKISTLFLIMLFVIASTQLLAQTSDLDADNKFYKLTRSAPQKYIDGDKAGAAAEANEILATAPSFRRSWNYGNAVHVAHLVLGRIAADDGDISEAKRRLFESVTSLPYSFDTTKPLPWEEPIPEGRSKASPQIDTFGPDMSLARVLLIKGEKAAVLKYLELCGKFWTLGDKQLAQWRENIQAGEIPNFKANLVYFFPKETSKEH